LFKMSPRELKRMMKRMGIDVDVEEVQDAERVIIERSSGSRLVIESPQVTLMKMRGQTILQAVGELKEEEAPRRAVETPEEPVEIRDEDVELVALEAGVTLEEARQALALTRGDLAQAIMLLQAKKKA